MSDQKPWESYATQTPAVESAKPWEQYSAATPAAEPEKPGVFGTLKEGAKSAARAIGSTVNTYTGNNQGVVEKAEAQHTAVKAPELQSFYDDVQRNKEDDAPDAGLWDGIKNVGGAIFDNPKGAGLAIVEQFPNSVPTLAGGYAGMKAGAAIGAAAGAPFAVVGAGPGALAGSIIGGLSGMFLGNAAIETGHKAMEAAGDGEFTAEEASQVKQEGAIKGGVITAIDGLTLGLGGAVAKSMQRTATGALESATRKTLIDNGVDVSNVAAVMAAKQNPAISKAVRESQDAALKVTDTFKRRAVEAGTLLGMESVGEGLGEYLGELAATGKADITDAVLEAALSLGQSSVEAGWNMSRTRDLNRWQPADDSIQPMPTAENPNPAPVARPDPNAGVISRTAGLLPAPQRLALPSPEPVFYGDGAGQVSQEGPARDVDRELRTVPGREPRMGGGAGMDQQTERGINPLIGELIPAPSVTGEPANALMAGETIDARPEIAGIPDLRPQGFIVDSQGQAEAGRVNNLQSAEVEPASGLTGQAQKVQRPSFEQVLDQARSSKGLDAAELIKRTGASRAQAARAVAAITTERTVLGATYKGMPGANKARKTLANPDAFEVVKGAEPKTFRIQAKVKANDDSRAEPANERAGSTIDAAANGQSELARVPVSEQPASDAGQPSSAGTGVSSTATQRNGQRSLAPRDPRRVVNRERDSVVQAAIKLGGLTSQWRQDTTGDTRGNKMRPGVGALWSDKTGTSLDDMASLLDQHGYVPPSEMSRDGGVAWLQQALKDELAGLRTHYAPGAAKQEADLILQEAERYGFTEDDDWSVLEAKLDAAFDLIDANAELEARREESLARAAELDRLFGDDNERSTEKTGTAPAGGRVSEQPASAEQSAGAGNQSTGRSESAEGSRAEAPRDSFALTQQTEQELSEQAAAQAAAAQAEAEQARAESQRAQADKDRNDFTLTGSDRVADVAASRGQNDMFGAQVAQVSAQPASVADQLASIDEAELSALIDDVVEEKAATQTSKPLQQRSTKAKTAEGKPRLRAKKAPAERVDTSSKAEVSRSAGQIAKSLGVNVSSAGMNALEGLAALFGGNGRLGSGLAFDEETYAKAKPHFQAVLNDVQAAGKDLRDLIRALVGHFGDGVKPYILRFAQDLKQEQADNERSVERVGADSAENAEQGSGADIRDGSTGAGRGAEQLGNERGGARADATASVSGTGPAAAGERSNTAMDGEASAVGAGAAGRSDSGRGGIDSTSGLHAERAADQAANQALERAVESQGQKAAVTASDKPGSVAEIKAQMPFLTDGQAQDVAFAERRLSKDKGFGVLFTNGTGTGKTFTGLGVAARSSANGKGNILVVAPKQPIVDAWIKAAGAFFGLNAKPLASTSDHGDSGMVVTTYANLGDNRTLADREWDMVIADEAHYLSSAEDGKSTKALDMLRALSERRGTESDRVRLRNRGKVDRLNLLRAVLEQDSREANQSGGNHVSALEKPRAELEREHDALEQEINDKIERERSASAAKPDADKPRAVFLSATPFAYEKNVVWAQEFLFDWGNGEQDMARGYNSGGDFDRFMMQHFGYRMRYNKLTQPDSNVDSALMQRAFNSWLKKEGALSGRALDSAFDYDRLFVTVESPIGRRVDEALKWLRDMSRKTDDNGVEQHKTQEEHDGFNELHDGIVKDSFDYQSRMYFLEAIKAKEALPHIRAQLAAGRKVLVMHDFKKGGAVNPFRVRFADEHAEAANHRFRSAFPDLVRAFDALPSPINQLSKAFPDALIYNGDVSAKRRIGLQDQFNSDEDGAPRLMIAQGDAMREGVSIHDTTGKFPRVLVHLGMPVKPTASIQQEGRIYRTGQASDALFRYFTIGTAWERAAFASKIAARASAAENLAMGEQARGLKQAFITAYENADLYEPGFNGEGLGGKAVDMALAQALTPWDSAKTFYFGTKKQGKGRSSQGREGNDYFATPEPVGLKMVEWADIRSGESVLEPSAGHGAIARWFPETSRVRVIEQSAELASRVALHVNGDIVHGDFESHHVVNKYDAIVMNPPYGLGGSVAIPHLAKATEHLRRGGRVVALIPTGPAADKRFDNWFYGQDKDGNSLLPDLHLVADVKMPAVTFERAGTSVATRIVVIEKVTPEQAAQMMPASAIDLTSTAKIGELFDRLEDLTVRPRAKPAEASAEQTAPAKSVEPKQTYAQGAAALVDKYVTDAPIIEHVTGKGKTLRGVIVKGMTLDDVKAKLDKYAFRKDGGVFVREDYIARPDGAASDGPVFSRARGNGARSAGAVLKHDAVKAIVERVNARLGLTLPLHVHRSESELFAAVPEIGRQAQREGAEGQVNAVYYNGAIHVVTNAFARKFDVELAIVDALAHEGQGHYGIRSLFNNDRVAIDAALREFFSSIGGVIGVRRLAAKHGIEDIDLYLETAKGMTGTQRAGYLADELLAHLQGKAATAGLSARAKAAIQAYIGAVREWLRQHGFSHLAKGTDADIAWLLKRMREAAKVSPSGQSSAPRFVRTDQTSSPQFKQWFGQSKVVADSKPKVLYHGTAEDFTIFDQSRSGNSTGHATSPLGIFMTSNRELAEGYARNASDGMPGLANVMELFASIGNPYVMTVEESQSLDTPLKARRRRSELEQAGHDGIRLKGTDVWVAFNNYQVKSATNNTGMFDEFDPDIRFSRSSNATDREALQALGLGSADAQSVLEKITSFARSDFKALMADWGRRAEEGLFDGLLGIKRAEEAVGVTDPNQQGYVSARLATGIADVMHSVMRFGAPQWKDGVIQYKDGTRGLLDVLAELGPNNLNAWLGWLGAKRGQLLKAQGLENNLTDAEINELLAGAKGKEELFARVYQEYAQINEAVLDLAQEAGLVDADSRKQWTTDYYVPFYRELEGENMFSGPRTSRGLSHQTAAIRALKGGNTATKDLLTNILQGWSKRIDASMKNKAMLEVVANLKDSEFLSDESSRFQQVSISRSQIAKHIRSDRKALKQAAKMLGLKESANFLQVSNEMMKPSNEGFEKVWMQVAPTDPDIIRVQRDGKNEYYRVNDESLLRGLKAMGGTVFTDPVTTLGRKAKQLLTTGVTSSPDFILRNFIRDGAHAWVINPDGFKFFTDSMKGINQAFKEDPHYRAMSFAGASFQGGYIHGGDPESAAQMVRRALGEKGLNTKEQDTYMGSLVNSPAKMAGMIRTGWEKYRGVSDKVENANRLATYKRALEAGKSERQAAFESKDLMDFSMRGNFIAAQWFTDVVPFLNARMQGLYKLGRAARGDKAMLARHVAMKGSYLALFTLALAALNGDDERYKDLPDWDKDLNWHVFLGEAHFRIPKPFELGLVFGTLPERLFHAMLGEQDSGDLGRAVAHGVFETLGFNPVPQLVHPIRELQANRNFFRDAPIEDMSDEGKLPEARYDERTSAFSKAAGQVTGPALGVSPKQLDHLIRGYLGTMGGYALSMSNVIAGIGNDAESPDFTAADVPLVKVLYSGDAVRSSRYQAEFYDMLTEADQLHRTIKGYREEGRVELAESLLRDNAAKVRHRPALGLARKQLGNIRNQMDAVHRDKAMSGTEKRERLNDLQRRANSVAERVVRLAGEDF